MATALPAFPWPPRSQRLDGTLRRVGVELEMNGLSLDHLTQLSAEFLGCEIQHSSRYERTLHGDPAGDWVVELDFSLLKKLGREQRRPNDLGDELMNSAEEALKWLSEGLVPLELVSPPLPLDRLHEIDTLIEHLRRAGAKGTGDRLANAFGMQFNPEVPDTEPTTLLAYLQAFLCLHDWLRERANINFTRRLTSYVDPFPLDYVRQVIAADYQPGLTGLIDDYLTANPTRNRALDLLPLFKHLDPQRVLARAGDELIKPRPTFHYRLPDCLIDQPGWGLHLAWGDWLEVERLACDPARLKACCQAYARHLDQGLARLLDNWPEQINHHWLSDMQ
ncbi:alpha-L-fucosidase [Pseudomonas sp. WN033]|nr:alpha-L-fucosidase [Pseudomonas sp. WN033]